MPICENHKIGFISKCPTCEFQKLQRGKCACCGNGTDPDDICDDCWSKIQADAHEKDLVDTFMGSEDTECYIKQISGQESPSIHYTTDKFEL